MKKTITIERSTVEKLQGFAKAAHQLTEEVKLSPSEKQRRRLEYISDLCDQLQDGLKKMLN